MKKFQIGVVQLNYDKSDEAVIDDIKKYLKIAKEKGVDIICFPESSLYLGPKKNLEVLYEIREECKKHKMWSIVVGHFMEKGHEYNMAVLIDNKGNVAGKHRKVHISFPGEAVAGSKFDIYITPFGKIGIAICWDISHPHSIHRLAKKGAKVIFCPMYWALDVWAHRKHHVKPEKKILESLILTRAYENLMYVAFCNAYDKTDPELVSYSAIAEPHKIVSEIFNKEGLITADIDLGYLKRIRKRYHKEYYKLVSKD